ncbi:MAG: D-2-hydroxyacid dehydrogenase [Anaerolineales bacterium]|nr:D-2-hydroxyacid dehydrogenase [Anaerolineales bacterium]
MDDTIEVLLTIPFEEDLVDKLRQISPRLNINLVRARQANEIPEEAWTVAEVLYTSTLLPEPEQAPNLRWIQFHWAGVDHALEAPILSRPGLVATNLSGAAATQVAEYVLAMLLALSRHLPEVFAHQKRADWPKDRWERFTPQELRHSTVGIVGYGSIGRQVARLLQPSGATLLAAKRDAMHPQDAGYVPDDQGDPEGDLVHRLYPGKALRAMLKECDFVVITLPKTAETLNLLSTKELAAMKPGASLIDVSRGGILDHEALLAALKEKKLAGAALDVFPEEPLPADSPLWKMPNVIITPHVSGATAHYDERAVKLFSGNLIRYLSGLPLYNLIDLERGY